VAFRDPQVQVPQPLRPPDCPVSVVPAMLEPITGRNPWPRGHAKTLVVGAAVFAVSAIVIVALLADADVDPGRKAVERLSSSLASCGQIGAPPCDSASVTHLRQVRAGSRDGPVVLVSGEDPRRISGTLSRGAGGGFPTGNRP